MTTELLLPITVPTNRTRLEVWKERNAPLVIFNWSTEMFWEKWADAKWEAMKRLPDCTYIRGLGDTEEEACFALAEKLRLPWLESIAQKDLML